MGDLKKQSEQNSPSEEASVPDNPEVKGNVKPGDQFKGFEPKAFDWEAAIRGEPQEQQQETKEEPEDSRQDPEPVQPEGDADELNLDLGGDEPEESAPQATSVEEEKPWEKEPPKDKEERKKYHQGLRGQVKQKHEELESTKLTLKQKEAELQTLQEQAESYRKQVEEVQKQSGQIDPSQHPKVREIEGQFFSSMDRRAKRMGPEGNRLRQEVQGLIGQFEKINSLEGDEYNEAYDKFTEEIANRYPRHSQDVMNVIVDGVDALNDSRAAREEVKQNADVYMFEQAQKQYSGAEAQFHQLREQMYAVDETPIGRSKALVMGLAQKNEVLQKDMERLEEQVKRIMLPMKPVKPGSMDPADHQKLMQKDMEERTQAMQEIAAQVPAAFAALRMVEPILKRLGKTAKKSAEPARRSNSDSDTEGQKNGSREQFDAKKFEPAPPDLSGVFPGIR